MHANITGRGMIWHVWHRMLSRLRRGILMLVLLILGLVLWVNSDTTNAGTLEPLLRAAGLHTPTKPMPADDFKLPDATGRQHRLRDQQGNVVFLNFWATWCPPCLAEMPSMQQLYQTLRQHAFVMWAVNMQQSSEQVAQYMRAEDLDFSALIDTDGKVVSLYKIQGLPTTYLIDCAGNVVGWAVGPREWMDDPTRTLLTAMLNDAKCDKTPR